ncbi:hypothetical protein Q8W71_32065 [Methylobacterium sp. NEAU 140]|uniref:hypothetical protein n=1 Tax=Methylobacterium sp. NEAU 140 TaxID=3064945 RepID=UPI002732D6D1|nr:hypothetical protein [Methylobacterium sp. NEAU 140]MDP4027211.1 hypothetical protein [Methylobacterium sp. NEAU 140]
MAKIRALGLVLAICATSTGMASAQTDTTGTGGGPLTTEKAPNTTVVGQTKPPSRDASPTSTKPIERSTPRQAIDDAISRRICNGCLEYSTGKGFSSKTSVGIPQGGGDARRDDPRDTGQSNSFKQQMDLDTVALASAHRERAKSSEEKTNGLWQSWLVSVCDGCGDQKPAQFLKRQDYPLRDVMATGSVDQGPQHNRVQPHLVKRSEVPKHGSLAADLSPENVGTIRRMGGE